MTTEQRKQRILSLLKEQDSVKVTELSRLFNVSEVTIRNYLEDMEKKGLLSRIHGGAIHSYKPYYNMNLTQRMETNQDAKRGIAEKIAGLIEPNDTVMLNAGTTTLLAFREFPVAYNLNIVTNSISIALEAACNPNYNVILLGGSVNTKYQFTYGSSAINELKKYNADKLIMSVDGIDLEKGFTTYYEKESDIDVAMIKQSKCCIVAADRSKFGHVAFATISDLSVADYVVTSAPLHEAYAEKFASQGVTVL